MFGDIEETCLMYTEQYPDVDLIDPRLCSSSLRKLSRLIPIGDGYDNGIVNS